MSKHQILDLQKLYSNLSGVTGINSGAQQKYKIQIKFKNSKISHLLESNVILLLTSGILTGESRSAGLYPPDTKKII